MSPSASPANILSPEHLILGLLKLAPAHGYELQQRITRDLGQLWHLHFNQIYGILHRLEAEGKVAGVLEKGNNAPTRRRYNVTFIGERDFDAWLHTPTVSSVRIIRIEFITRLYFARQACPELVDQILAEQVAATRQSLTQQQAVLAAMNDDQAFNRLGVALRIRTLAGVIEWLGDCREALP